MSDNITQVNYSLFEEDDFTKDCPNSPFIPTVMPPVKRIIAIGDIHGDLNLAVRSFILASLIDKDLNWIAKPPDTVVVQVGDQIDSCRPGQGMPPCHEEKQSWDNQEDIKVMDFFDAMDKKARAVGGAVISLLGNHEMMNVMGDFRYASYTNSHEFDYDDKIQKYKGIDGRREVFARGSKFVNNMACTRNSVVIIGSNIFAHAGVLPILARKLEHLNLGNKDKIKYLNKVVRKWLMKKNTTQEVSNLINDPQSSPFWIRIYGNIPMGKTLESNECEIVKNAIDTFKIGNIIVGHTPQLMMKDRNGINGTCKDDTGVNRLYRIDGGFAKGFKVWKNHNVVEVLEIIDDNKFNILREEDFIINNY
jgi:hypothetical protein